MSDSPQNLFAALTDLARANEELRQILGRNAQILRDTLDSFTTDRSATDLLTCRHVIDGQSRSDEAMTLLFEARHNLRRVLVIAALTEGMPVPTLATLLGVRPDLIQAYASERT